MICFFCGDPAAHPATGCQYTARALACFTCTVSFWVWAKRHTNGKAGRRTRKDGTLKPETALSFYEHAGRREC